MRTDSNKMNKKIHFERAIFTSWYCSIGDCTYCYMSTQKNLIKDPKKARRSMSSILAEAYICKKLGWKLGFISAGYGTYTEQSILSLCKSIYQITNEKLWLNIGVLNEKTIKTLEPYLKGICGAVETTNLILHKKIAPNKPINPIENMYKICNKYKLKNSMTFIIGLGETIEDFQSLKKFIFKNNIKKIIFYALNPIKGTVFENSKGPDIDYYISWIKLTRKIFPNIKIVAAPWVNRVNHIGKMLKAGADSITKFPAIKLFNTKFAKTIETEIRNSGYKLEGTFTKLPKINFQEIENLHLNARLKKDMTIKLKEYIKFMEKN